LTYDKTRFIDEIISIQEWIFITYDKMLIKNYETMMINEKLRHSKRRMIFIKTTWISSANLTLIFVIKLMTQKYDRNSISKTLIHVKTGKQICEIQRRFGMQLLECNLIQMTCPTVDSKMLWDRSFLVLPRKDQNRSGPATPTYFLADRSR
jgi:hypothetical protein